MQRGPYPGRCIFCDVLTDIGRRPLVSGLPLAEAELPLVGEDTPTDGTRPVLLMDKHVEVGNSRLVEFHHQQVTKRRAGFFANAFDVLGQLFVQNSDNCLLSLSRSEEIVVDSGTCLNFTSRFNASMIAGRGNRESSEPSSFGDLRFVEGTKSP